jgi:hypothetical protein
MLFTAIGRMALGRIPDSGSTPPVVGGTVQNLPFIATMGNMTSR